MLQCLLVVFFEGAHFEVQRTSILLSVLVHVQCGSDQLDLLC